LTIKNQIAHQACVSHLKSVTIQSSKSYTQSLKQQKGIFHSTLWAYTNIFV